MPAAFVIDKSRAKSLDYQMQVWLGPLRADCNRPNLLKNGNFEDWVNSSTPAYWTIGTGTIAQSSDTDSAIGAWSQYSVDITQTTAGWAAGLYQLGIPCKPNTTYTCSARAKFTGTGSGAYLYSTIDNGASYQAIISTGSSSWSFMTGSFTTGASTTVIGIALVPYAAGATTRDGFFDEVYLCEGSYSPSVETYIHKGSNFDATTMGWTNYNDHLKDKLTIEHTDRSTIMTLNGINYGANSLKADRAVLLKVRLYADGVWGTWQDWFLGYVVSKSLKVDWKTNTWTCRVEGDYQYLTTQRVNGHAFGPTNLAIGKTATASSTLADPTLEANTEYLSAASVAPGKAIDGNMDTLWISNGTPTYTEASYGTNTPDIVKINQIYAGDSNINWGSRPQWIELMAANTIMSDGGFEAGTIGAWWSASAGVTRSTVTTSPHSGTYCMQVVFDGTTRTVQALNYISNYPSSGPSAAAIVGIEYHCVLWLKGAAGGETLVVRFLGTKGQKQTGAYNQTSQITLTTSWKKIEMWGEATDTTISISLYKNPSAAVTFYVDDVRLVGGAYLTSQKDASGNVVSGELLINWVSNTYNRDGVIEFDSLGIDKIGGDRSIVLCNDEELYKKYFWMDQGATVVSWRKADFMFIDGTNGTLQLQRAASQTAVLNTHDYVVMNRQTIPDNDSWNSYTSPFPSSNLQSYARTVTQITGSWNSNSFPCPGMANPYQSEILYVDLGNISVPTLSNAINATSVVGTDPDLLVSDDTIYSSFGVVLIDAEQIYYPSKLEGILQNPIRGYNGTTAASHSAGASVYPYLDGGAQNMYYVSAIGWRRPTPPVVSYGEVMSPNQRNIPQNYTILYSTLSAPRDPSVETVTGKGDTWLQHPDWSLWCNVTNNKSGARLHASPEDDVPLEAWPPLMSPDYLTGLRGIRMRWVCIGIHQMVDKGRAKLNEVFIYERALDSGMHGKYLGSRCPDVKGMIGHYLVYHFGKTIDKFSVDRNNAVDISAGLYYGSLTIMDDFYSKILDDLCKKLEMTWYVDRFNCVHFVPSVYNPLTGYGPDDFNWNKENIRDFTVTYYPKQPVAQVQLNAYNPQELKQYVFEYPQTPNARGGIKKIDSIVVGSANEATLLAMARYFVENRGWAIEINTGICEDLELYQTHTVTWDFDSDGSEFTNYHFKVTGFTEELTFGPVYNWTTKVKMEQLP